MFSIGIRRISSKSVGGLVRAMIGRRSCGHTVIEELSSVPSEIARRMCDNEEQNGASE